MKKFMNSQKWWLALLLIIVVGCQQDEVVPIEEPKATIRRIVTAKDVPEVAQTLLQKIGLSDGNSLFSANTGETTSQLKINWDQIMQLVDTTGRETYAFGLQDLDDDPKTFYNLIMRYNADHQAHRPYILKYTMADDFVEEFYATGSLANFKGATQKIMINRPASGTPRGTAFLGAGDGGLTVGEPCPGETSIGGGGDGGSGGEDSAYECHSYLVTNIWYSQACSSGVCDPPVEISRSQSIVTECGWTNGSTSADGSNDCEPDDGEIPIITIIPDPLDLIMGNNELSPADTEKLRATLNELLDSQCVYQQMFNHLTSNNIKIDFGYNPNTSSGGFNYRTGAIGFRNSDNITLATLKEELFHAYQHDHYTGGLGQYTGTGRSNIEFEAKFMADLIETVYGNGFCCTAFGSAANNYPQVVIDYNLWLSAITDGGSYTPEFSDIILDYFYWMGIFRQLNPAYNYPITTALNPTAAFDLINECN